MLGIIKNVERYHLLMPSFLENSKQTCLLEIQIIHSKKGPKNIRYNLPVDLTFTK